MYIDIERITALNVKQIAYPVGPEKDSYNINSWFKQDIETEEITSEHELIKNFTGPEKKEGVKYKEDTKFRQLLYVGTYKDCVKYFLKNVMNTQKEWVYDEHINYVYPEN